MTMKMMQDEDTVMIDRAKMMTIRPKPDCDAVGTDRAEEIGDPHRKRCKRGGG